MTFGVMGWSRTGGGRLRRAQLVEVSLRPPRTSVEEGGRSRAGADVVLRLLAEAEELSLVLEGRDVALLDSGEEVDCAAFGWHRTGVVEPRERRCRARAARSGEMVLLRLATHAEEVLSLRVPDEIWSDVLRQAAMLLGPAPGDVKVVRHRAGGIDGPDDLSLPYQLGAVMSAPDFMQVAFVLLYGGTEKFVVRGRTSEALEAFAASNSLIDHPRLIRMAIWGPRDEMLVAWRRGMVLRDVEAERRSRDG